MILLAVFLGSLGLADLVRARFAGARLLWLAAAIGIVAFILGSIGSGQAWWWSPIAAAAIIAWLLATREPDSRPGSPARDRAGNRAGYRAGYWAVGGIAAVVAVAFVWGPRLPTAAGPLVDWYRTLPYTPLASVSFTAFLLTVGGALFLVETANVIVRLTLRGEKSPTTKAVPTVAEMPRRSWWRAKPAATVAPEPVAPEPAPEASFTELKGGRFIGPLERLFLLALVLSGAFTAVAALVAAKGIIRFPEISKDAVGGSKAEYFLVGSFASWALVLLTVLLVLVGS